MFCPKCGTQNEEGASFCSKCGASLSGSGAQSAGGTQPASNIQLIPTYLVQAILVTLFCCLPFGIVAIVKAAGVSKFQGMGDYDLALKASNEAKMWCWVSFGIGFAAIALYILFVVVLGAATFVTSVQ